jgi:hypothetical protein
VLLSHEGSMRVAQAQWREPWWDCGVFLFHWFSTLSDKWFVYVHQPMLLFVFAFFLEAFHSDLILPQYGRHMDFASITSSPVTPSVFASKTEVARSHCLEEHGSR